jgi:hypothetical protein
MGYIRPAPAQQVSTIYLQADGHVSLRFRMAKVVEDAGRLTVAAQASAPVYQRGLAIVDIAYGDVRLSGFVPCPGDLLHMRRWKCAFSFDGGSTLLFLPPYSICHLRQRC